MHTTTQMRARWHRTAGQHIIAGRPPSAAEISAALQQSMMTATTRRLASSRQGATQRAHEAEDSSVRRTRGRLVEQALTG